MVITLDGYRIFIIVIQSVTLITLIFGIGKIYGVITTQLSFLVKSFDSFVKDFREHVDSDAEKFNAIAEGLSEIKIHIARKR